MRDRQAIDKEILELQEKLNNIPEQRCEVYQRICGYFRATKNWNIGKAEEYKERKTFAVPAVCAG